MLNIYTAIITIWCTEYTFHLLNMYKLLKMYDFAQNLLFAYNLLVKICNISYFGINYINAFL